MAKPNQPRDIKPQSDDRPTPTVINNSLGRIIAINIVTTVLICVIVFVINMLFLNIIYFST